MACTAVGGPAHGPAGASWHGHEPLNPCCVCSGGDGSAGGRRVTSNLQAAGCAATATHERRARSGGDTLCQSL